MKTIKIKIALGMIALVFGLSGSLHAELLDQVQISGKVHNVGKSDVTLKTETGLVKVPKKFFKNQNKLRPGNQTIRVSASLTEVVKLNKRNPASKQKK